MQQSAFIISNARIVTVYEGFCVSWRASSIALVTSVIVGCAVIFLSYLAW